MKLSLIFSALALGIAWWTLSKRAKYAEVTRIQALRELLKDQEAA